MLLFYSLCSSYLYWALLDFNRVVKETEGITFQQAVICASRMFLSPNTIWACCFTQSQCWLKCLIYVNQRLHFVLIIYTFSSQASSLPLLLSWNIAVFINLNTLSCFFGITRISVFIAIRLPIPSFVHICLKKCSKCSCNFICFCLTNINSAVVCMSGR